MIKTVKIDIDQITNELSQSFDYKFDGNSQFEVPNLPKLPTEFGIGLIVGPSGSGKSSLLEQFGKEKTINWNKLVKSLEQTWLCDLKTTLLLMNLHRW